MDPRLCLLLLWLIVLCPTTSPLPTASPTGREAVLYRTWHVGKKCVSSATIYDFYGGYMLNKCSRDAIDPNSPHRYVCMVGANKYSLNRLVYDEFDPSCNQAPIQTALITHDYMCRRDASTGFYVMTHCDSLPQALLSPTQLVVRSYDDATCVPANLVTPLQTRNVILGACQPVFYLDPLLKGRKKASDTGEILFYRKITYVSGPLGLMTWDQGVTITNGASGGVVGAGVLAGNTAGRMLSVGSNTTTGATLTLMVSRFKFLDSECKGEAKMYVQVQYTLQATSPQDVLCRPDPLFQGKFYRVAAAAVPSQAPSVSPTNPTYLPTARPSPRPSSKPSPRPSATPTTFPTGQPSAQPSCQPTRQPTSRPSSVYETAQGEKSVIKSLWQGLGSFSLNSYTNWDFSPAGQASVCGPLRWARINCTSPTVLSYYPSSFFNNFAPPAGNLLATIPMMPNLYSVSIDVFMTSASTSWSWIAALSKDATQDMYMPGFRVNYGNVMILYQAPSRPLSSTWSYSWPLNTWVTIFTSIDYINQLTSLKLTGGLTAQAVKAFEQSPASPLSNCQVYASGAAGWFPSFNGYIANFLINLAPAAVGSLLPVSYYPSSTFPTGVVASASNQLDAISLPTYYTLSFDFFHPTTSSVNDLNSLISLYSSVKSQGIPTVGLVSGTPLKLFVDYGNTFASSWLYLPVSAGVWNTATIYVDTVAYRVVATIKQGFTVVVSKSATMKWGGRGAVYSGVGVWTNYPNANPTNTVIRNLAIAPGGSNPTQSSSSPTAQVNWDSSSSRVLAFDMASSGLVGTLATNLGYLKTLQKLNFDQNSQISGKLPSALATMSRIESLVFGGSKLTGTLPTFLVHMPNLHYIDFHSCSFSGTLPSELGLFRGDYLNLAANKFTGSLPMTLGKMTQFAGSAYGVMAAPREGIFTFSNGQPLALTTPYGDFSSMSSLTGCVPFAISGFKLTALGSQLTMCSDQDYLRHFYTEVKRNPALTNWNFDTTNDGLYTNPVCSSAAPWAGISCTTQGQVSQISLGGLGLNGTLPMWLFVGMRNLTSLDLHGNLLRGTIGEAVKLLPSLVNLDLSANQLSGQIPGALGTLTQIVSIKLHANNLVGPIPFNISAMGKLRTLDLHNNTLTGSLPMGLFSLTGLSYLDVSTNRLGGFLYPEVGGLYSIATLLLNDNRFSGPLPAELETSPYLSTLSLQGNFFNSTSCLPASMQKPSLSLSKDPGLIFCPDQLYLSHIYSALTPASRTKLTGWSFATVRGAYTSPPCASSPSTWLGIVCTNSKVTSLNLGGLGLVGTLPQSIGEMTSLMTIDVSGNAITGLLPYQLGLLTTLTSLKLNNNAFSKACIPTVLTRAGVSVVTDASVPTCGDDMAALAAFYTATGKSQDITWNFAKNTANSYINDCCNPAVQSPTTCVFIQCAGVRVRVLGLSSGGFSSTANRLSGSLPEEIGLLDKLQNIDLNGNQHLTGTLPSSLGRMTSLTSIIMDNCGLTGTLPSTLGQLSSLQTLALSGNSAMSGPLHRALGLLSEITSFRIPPFTGTIPLTFNAMYQVRDFAAASFTGCLPASMFGYVTAQRPLCKDQDALLEIYMQLGPTVQALLNNWNFATTTTPGIFASPVCPVSGAASTWTGVTCTGEKVTGLNFNSMGLTGPFPFYALASMSALTSFSANQNALSSTIPSYLFQMAAGLTTFSLRECLLVGSIPSSFFMLQRLVSLDLSANFLNSSISTFISQMPSLTTVKLDNNFFSGPVPNDLEMAPLLSTLTLQNNKFLSSACLSSNLQARAGFAVMTDPSIVGCRDQDYLVLLMNAFQNKSSLTNWNSAVVNGAYSSPPCANTPSTWLGITCTSGKITALSLRGLDIGGSIASAIGGLTSLVALDLSQPVTGAGFTSTLPMQIGLLNSLTALDISSNKNLNGCLPPRLIRAGLRIVKDSSVSTCTFPDMAGLQGFYTAFGSPSVLKWAFALNRVGVPANNGVCNCASSQCDSRLWNLISCSGGRVDRIHGDASSFGGAVGTLASSLGFMDKLSALSLPGLGASLHGSIPLEIGGATNLRELSLNGSSLEGAIPSTLGLLSKLYLLHFENCSLSGTLPSAMGRLPLLTYLFLNGNQGLSGSIPLTWNALVQCVGAGCTMSLPWNQFSGCYPYAIASFKGNNPLCTPQEMLQEFYNAVGSPTVLETGGWNFGKSDGQFLAPVCPPCTARNLPACASTWVGITCNYVQSVGVNTVVGIALPNFGLPKLPLPLYALNGMRLSNIDLRFNAFSGPLPYYYAYLGDGVNPITVKLDNNQISSTLPSTLAQMTRMASLRSFSVANNALVVGTLPSTLQALSNLALLDVHGCKLTGTIPQTLPPSLTYLDLSENSLNGTIPATTLGNLQSLSFLSLAGQSLTGQVPTQIGSLLSLSFLDLSRSQLAGTVPLQISYLTRLGTLRLGFTSLSGPLPLALCNLQMNTTIDFVGSAGITCAPSCLAASFPSFTSGTTSVCAYTDIDYMSVLLASLVAGRSTDGNLVSWNVASNNLCSGWFYVTCNPDGLVNKISLTNDAIRGTLPTALGMLSGLTSLTISGTKMFGSLPSSLENLLLLSSLSLGSNSFSGSIPALGGLTSLVTLDLRNNRFQNNIPPTLSGLTKLSSLFLSSNFLTGTIGYELGSLTKLETFCIDGNQQITGPVPASFVNLVSLRTFLVNGNRLTGSIPNLCPATLISIGSNNFFCYPACFALAASFQKDPLAMACAPPPGLPASYVPSTEPQTNNLLGTIIVPEMYTLSFTINPRSSVLELFNILHLRRRDQQQSSSSLPAIYQNVDGKLLLHYEDQGLVKYQLATTSSIPLNEDSVVTITVDVYNRVVSMGVAGAVSLPPVSISIPLATQLSKNVDIFFSDSLSPTAKTLSMNLLVVDQLSYPQTASFLAKSVLSLATKATLLCYVALPQQFVISFDILRGPGPDSEWSMLTLWPYGGAAGPTNLDGMPNLMTMTGAGCNYNCTKLHGPNGAVAASGSGAGVPVGRWVSLWVTVDLAAGYASWQSSDGWKREVTSSVITGTFPSVQLWASNPSNPQSRAPSLSFIRNVVLSYSQPVGGMSLLRFGKMQAVKAKVWEGCTTSTTCSVNTFGPVGELTRSYDDENLNLGWTDPQAYIQFSFNGESGEQNPWTATQYDSAGNPLQSIGNGVISLLDATGLYFFFIYKAPENSFENRQGILFSLSAILAHANHVYPISFSGTSMPSKAFVDRFATQYGSNLPFPVPTSTPAILPMSVIAPSDAMIWLDASDAASMTVDAAGVTRWNSQVGTAYMAPQGTKPVICSDCLGGHPGVNFAAPSAPFFTPSPMLVSPSGNATLFFVGTVGDTGMWGGMWSHGSSDNGFALEVNSIQPGSSVLMVHWQTDNDNLGSQVSYVKDTPYLYVCTIVAGRTRTIAQYDAAGNVQTGQGSTGDRNIVTAQLGTNQVIYLMGSSNSEYARGVASEAIYYNRLLTPTEIAATATGLRLKWLGRAAPALPTAILVLPLTSSTSASTGANLVTAYTSTGTAVTFSAFYPGAYFMNSVSETVAANALLYSLPASLFNLPLSLSLWVRFEESGPHTTPVVLGSATTWGLAVFRNTETTTGLLAVDCWAANGVRVRSVSPVLPALHVWYHVAVTIAPGLTQRLYVNGAVAATTTTTSQYSAVVDKTGAALSNLRLGQSWDNSAGQYPFKGYLLDLRLFALQLDDAQVAAIYGSTTPPFDTAPTADPTPVPTAVPHG